MEVGRDIFWGEGNLNYLGWEATVRHLKKETFLWAKREVAFEAYSWRRKWQPTPVFLPGKFLSPVDCNPWSCKESDAIECTHTRSRDQGRWNAKLMKHFEESKGEKQVEVNYEWACKSIVELELPEEVTSGIKIDAIHWNDRANLE